MRLLLDHEKSPLLKVFFAALPVAMSIVNLKEALFYGVIISSIFGILTILFASLRSLFPQKVLHFAFLITLAAAGQVIWYISQRSPLWIVSVILLVPKELFKRKRLRKTFNRDTIITALGFLALLLFAGITEEILNQRLLIHFFQLPAGFLLVLFAAAVIWQNQPLTSSAGSDSDE